jgi:MFS transporter, DHA1 family, tetracycline resistance protein
VVLFVARALDGITGGNASVANAYLADITTESDRSISFGRLALSGNIGFIVGPALAGLLGATAWREVAPVTAALVISAGACLMIGLGLVDSRPCAREQIPERPTATRALGQEPRDCFEGTGPGRMSFAEIVRMPRVLRLLVLNVLVFFAFNIFYVAFPMYVVQDLHWTLAATGVFFSVLSALMVVVQGPVLTWAGRRRSDRTLVLAGSVLLALAFPFFGAAHPAGPWAGAALLALGNGLMWPSLLALLAQAAGTDAQGAVQGLAGSGAALSGIAGLLVGGFLFNRIDSAVFLAAAVTTLLVSGIGLGIQRTDAGRPPLQYSAKRSSG